MASSASTTSTTFTPANGGMNPTAAAAALSQAVAAMQSLASHPQVSSSATIFWNPRTNVYFYVTSMYSKDFE